MARPRVVLNVGGARFSLPPERLADFPLRRVSLLHGLPAGRELQLCDDFDRERNEYFFDRQPEAFGQLLRLARPRGPRAPRLCAGSLRGELRYWALDGAGPGLEPAARERPAAPPAGPRWLERMRRTFEEPASSPAARLLAAVSVLFVVVSVAVLCARTLPDWRAAAAEDRGLDERGRIVEAVCIGWFTAECVVRFLVSRDKCDFLRRPLNLIDLLAIAPYYASVLAALATGEDPQLQRAGVALRVLRALRVFWLIKLARHSVGLRTLGLTLRRCYREMAMLLVFVGVAMAVFGALSQLLEHGPGPDAPNGDFASIPSACWWVIISMTTVGYGDMYPVSVPGRILGGLCVVSGIVLLALPITFIYHSFVQCYHELRARSSNCARRLPADLLN